MKYQDLNNDQLHQAGIYLTAAEAVVRKHKVEVIAEDRRFRLKLGDKLVQVFTRRSGDWQPNALHPIADDTDGVVFLDLAGDAPQFYVTTGDWLRDDVEKHHGAYLAAHGGTRRDNPASRHHKVTAQRVAAWRDRWDALAAE